MSLLVKINKLVSVCGCDNLWHSNKLNNNSNEATSLRNVDRWTTIHENKSVEKKATKETNTKRTITLYFKNRSNSAIRELSIEGLNYILSNEHNYENIKPNEIISVKINLDQTNVIRAMVKVYMDNHAQMSFSLSCEDGTTVYIYETMKYEFELNHLVTESEEGRYIEKKTFVDGIKETTIEITSIIVTGIVSRHKIELLNHETAQTFKKTPHTTDLIGFESGELCIIQVSAFDKENKINYKEVFVDVSLWDIDTITIVAKGNRLDIVRTFEREREQNFEITK